MTLKLIYDEGEYLEDAYSIVDDEEKNEIRGYNEKGKLIFVYPNKSALNYEITQ